MKEITKSISSNKSLRTVKSAPKSAHFVTGHYSHYWCGKRNDQHLELRFIEPYFTGGTEENKNVTIHKCY